MTESQKAAIEKLVRNGQLLKMALDEFRTLSEAKAEEYITKGYATAPLTHNAATKDQKDSLRSYISQRIMPLNTTDIQNLSYADATMLLDIAQNQMFEEDKVLSQVNERVESDMEPATGKQIQKIKVLVEDGFLSPISTENLVAITKLTARKLIFKGEMKKRGGK